MPQYMIFAITTGDHRGIGAEVISKGLFKANQVLIFGDPSLYKPFKKFLPPRWHLWQEAEVFSPSWGGLKKGCLNFILPEAGHVSANVRSAYRCGRYSELATLGALAGKFAAVVTGPIDKNELNRGGYHFDGHTEMLRSLTKAPTVTMMLASPKMRVSLVTTHLPLREVSSKLSVEKILVCIENTVSALIQNFGIKKPRIAVLGLNPHASDNGLFGDEESRIIAPAIELARRKCQGKVIGPFPPDGFFAQWISRNHKEFDAVVCMYHDQGLIPVKLLDFKNTVNVSLGLPIVRTSVDHGIGLDIAGKHKADSSSFRAALKLAMQLTE